MHKRMKGVFGPQSISVRGQKPREGHVSRWPSEQRTVSRRGSGARFLRDLSSEYWGHFRAEKLDGPEHLGVREGPDADLEQEPLVPEDLMMK